MILFLSLFAIPFSRLYVPGTGDRLGVERVVQGLIFAAMILKPRVCLRWIPAAFLWFVAYCALRLAAGLVLAREYSVLWWPTTLELLQFLLPWSLFLFNLFQYREMRRFGLWAMIAGASLCALLHVAGVGTVDVDNGVEGRSSVFGQNANEVGETYSFALVALVALGLFRTTETRTRFLVFPLAALCATGLAKTGSRTGALYTALGILVLLPQTRAFVPRIKRYLMILLVAVVFAAVLYQIPTILKRIAPVASSDVTQREARARMIPVLWEIFLRSPLYGSGPDRYQYELTRRAMPYLTEKQQTICSHNLALLLLVETGVIGFLVFTTGLVKTLKAAWRARSGSLGLLPLGWILALTLGGLTIGSGLFSPLFWLAVAYSLAAANPERACFQFRAS